jgi:hypothetical protein
MSAVEEAQRTITEPLTWDEICARFPNQRVCVVEIEDPDPPGGRFIRARVVGFGTTATAAWERASVWRDRYDVFGHYFTGTIRVGWLPRVVMTDEIRQLIRVRGRPYRA